MHSFLCRTRLGTCRLGLVGQRKAAVHPCQSLLYVPRQKKRGKPLRLVLRKVLRNCQVNCAMHAWAMPLGERSTEDLTIATLCRHLHSIFSDVSFTNRY